MRWCNITYICFLSSLLIMGFYWLLLPELSLSTAGSIHYADFTLFRLENHPQAAAHIFLGIFGLIYLKIIWRLISPPNEYK